METQAVVQKNASRYLLLAQRWEAQLFGLCACLLVSYWPLAVSAAKKRPHTTPSMVRIIETLPVINFSIDASVETVCAAASRPRMPLQCR